MLESFGKIQDYSAVENIEGDEEKKKEKYMSLKHIRMEIHVLSKILKMSNILI
jgi:hypothetical protein